MKHTKMFKVHENMLTIFSNIEMQVKTMMKYTIYFLECKILKRLNIPSVDKNFEEMGLIH